MPTSILRQNIWWSIHCYFIGSFVGVTQRRQDPQFKRIVKALLDKFFQKKKIIHFVTQFLVLGVLEVMPLKFSCLSVSEGSKFDQLKSSTVKSSNKKETANHPEPNLFNQQQVFAYFEKCFIIMKFIFLVYSFTVFYARGKKSI